MSYTFYEHKLAVDTTSGQSAKFGSQYLFTPKSSPTYIGVNRDHYDPSNESISIRRGSGVCRFVCHTIPYNPYGPQQAESVSPKQHTPLTGTDGDYEKGQIRQGRYHG